MQKMHILSNTAKFSDSRPLLLAYNFSVTMATYSSYHLGAVASLNFFVIENMPFHFSARVYYGQMAGWIRIPLGMDYGGMPRPRQYCVRWGSTSPRKGAQQTPTFRPTALARIPAGPHFTHNPFCRLGIARRAALVAILPELLPV